MNTDNQQSQSSRLILITPILLLLFANVSHAQISIAATDFPGKSDTVRYSNSNSFLANFIATGANFTWNFGNLGAQSQTLLEHTDPDDADVFTQSLFGSTVLPTYRATYFLPARELPLAVVSNIVDLPVEEIYRFYRKTNQEMTVVGLSIAAAGFAVGKRADTIEIAYKFPMTFGQTYSSKGYVNLDFSAFAPFALKQYRQRDSEVDGWGTIITPYGSFDCLRIHHIIQELDSILIDLGEGPQWTPVDIPTIHEYEWWTKDQKGPILKAKANEIFGFPIVNEIQFRDKYRPELNVGLEELNASQFQIYPNPSKDFFSIRSTEDIEHIEITNPIGQVVMHSQQVQNIDVTQFTQGIYFLKITTTKGQIYSTRILKN